MHVTFNVKFTLLLLLVILVPVATFAENRSGAVTVSSSIGQYYFDNDQRWQDVNIYTLGLGYNFTSHWQFEAAIAATDDVYTRAAGPAGPGTDMYFFKTDLLYHLNPVDSAVFYLAGGIGYWSVNPSNATAFTEEFVNYGGGMNLDLIPDLPIRFDLRQVLFGGEWMKDVRNVTYSIGINSQFGGVSPQPVVVDADHDGIIDVLDQCPGTAAGAVVDQFGCLPDSDLDGVADVLDRCTATPKGTLVDTIGCPLDSDEDGVADLDDDCPGSVAGSVVDERGCVAEVAGFEPAQAVESAAVVPIAPVIKPFTPQHVEVRFQPGSDQISSRDADNLGLIAAQLANNPSKTLRIEGYTDSTGPANVNLRLSQERAEKVRQRLIDDFNIAPERIKAIGFGEENPIEDNATQFGRRINRRVEIIVE